MVGNGIGDGVELIPAEEPAPGDNVVGVELVDGVELGIPGEMDSETPTVDMELVGTFNAEEDIFVDEAELGIADDADIEIDAMDITFVDDEMLSVPDMVEVPKPDGEMNPTEDPDVERGERGVIDPVEAKLEVIDACVFVKDLDGFDEDT